MQRKTQGIVLSYIKYKETSIITKIFTRELGLKSYIINGVRSKTGKSKLSLFQPMTLLDLVVYDKPNSNISRISESKLAHTSIRIPFDFSRTGISLFLAEVISKSIYDEYQNDSLFDYIFQSIIHLDSERLKIAHFPLIFLINQAKYLGFAPAEPEEFFSEGIGHSFDPRERESVLLFLKDAMNQGFGSTQKLVKTSRQDLMDHLLEFYSLHLGQEFEWKTLAVLRQLNQ